jgi:phosphoglycolate phosphatase
VFRARRLFAAQPDAVPLFAQVIPALQQLHARGMPLALVTSNSARNCLASLGPHAALFTTRMCGISLQGKARRLRQLARLHRIQPDRLLYVGDQGSDAQAARAAGCGFAAVAWGYTSVPALQRHQPDLLLQQPADIAGLLDAPGT